MELKGKKMLFIGDSITDGVGVTSKEFLYWNRLKADGCIVKGYGNSGTSISKHQGELKLDWWKNYFRTRVPQMDDEADVVVVFGGTNDYGRCDSAMGSMNDRTDDTFYGALHNLFTDLINKYPKACLIAITPCHRLNENNLYNEVGVRCVGTLEDYVDAIKEVAAYYAIPVLDLYRISGFQPEIEENRSLYMPDGLHPSDLGHERIYNLLKGMLKRL